MSKTDQATSPGGGPQVGQAAPPGRDVSEAPQPVCLGPENEIAPRFSVWRRDPCLCLGSLHLRVSSPPVWGWKEKGDWSSLKGAAYIQMQRPSLQTQGLCLTILNLPLRHRLGPRAGEAQVRKWVLQSFSF